MAANDIKQLEPKAVWEIFAGMTQVPRPSKKEAQIQKHFCALAEKLGFDYTHEPVGNIIIRIPATPGHERAPITVLQGHLDMVPEKNRDTQHDFEKDPIRTIIDKDKDLGLDIVRADGTTLGADNGMGVAMALAAASSKNVVHGPLEILLTCDEEAGMTGAKALKPDSFKGRRLINLDAEEDDFLYIGCAGGCDSNLTWSYGTKSMNGESVHRVSVRGLRGGHSGGDIHEGRGNAIKLLVRTLRRAGQGVRLVEFEGGSMRNAIPREAHAIVAIPASNAKSLSEAAAAIQNEGRAESFESGLSISVESATADAAMSFEDTRRWLDAMTAIPDGVMGMHPKVPELVQTSNNNSTVACEQKADRVKLRLGTLTRSSSDSRVEVAKDQIGAVAVMSGAELEHGNQYPGWEPNPSSALLETVRSQYVKLFGEEPTVAAIHAGLECGIIGKRVGEMDMVSFGPTIRGAHSPDERVYIDSVAKSYKLLCAVLGVLAAG
ncbi:MAG: aminoacyl-histidine dipeptidase [Phycisphaerales bacterium]|nr:aminoacyl-histidine dipeptidase [Phycisphaerales bacterium]MCB9856927.1 aminoacyl-histidine dipeptidase [Phycisphaerales bacterium]MCB9861946.1 aminoacyl-histidine dipeptidase [Phycisphaerales bacterium]